MTVAENIQNIIRESGIKQKVIAERAGWDDKRFSALLTGRITFKAEYLPAICMALNKTPDEILKFDSIQGLDEEA